MAEPNTPALAPMDERTFSEACRRIAQNAINFIEDEVGPQREKSSNYMRGNVSFKAQEGRSSLVMTTVRDSVEGAMPSLMRVFGETDKMAEFIPDTADQVEAMADATEFVNLLLFEQNNGWTLIHDYCKDGLSLKNGIFKAFWEEEDEVKAEEFSGYTEQDFLNLSADPEVDVTEVEVDENGFYSGTVERTDTQGRIVVVVVPPENYIVDKYAETADEAEINAEYSTKTISELVAADYDYDEILPFSSTGVDDETGEKQARSGFSQSETTDAEGVDPTLRTVRVTDAYMYVDKNGDGVAERYHVVMIGDSYHLLDWEEADLQPYCPGTPFRVPHQVIGVSLSDLTIDMQDLETTMTRQAADNGYAVNNPRPIVIENQLAGDGLSEVQDTRWGAPIRVKSAGGIAGWLEVPYVGDKILQFLNYMKGRKEERTGVSAFSLGLDPEALQSTPTVGVQAAESAATAKVEMMARVMGETGIKSVYEKLYALAKLHLDKPLQARLTNGTFKEFDPSQWPDKCHVRVNVGLGKGNKAQRLAGLTATAAKQEQILTTAGPENEITSVQKYRDTLAQITEETGYMDPNKYWLTEEEALEVKARKDAQPPQPTPEMIKAQSDAAKVEADAKLSATKAQADAATNANKAQADAELNRWKAEQEVILNRDKLAADIALKEKELATEAALEREKMAMGLTGGSSQLREVSFNG